MMGLRIVPGMLMTDGHTATWRVFHDGHGIRFIPNIPGHPAVTKPVPLAPLLEDRATFLLALDQLAERSKLRSPIFGWSMWGDCWFLEGHGETNRVAFIVAAGPDEPVKALRLALEQTAP